jgi:hypothetical protein
MEIVPALSPKQNLPSKSEQNFKPEHDFTSKPKTTPRVICRFCTAVWEGGIPHYIHCPDSDFCILKINKVPHPYEGYECK